VQTGLAEPDHSAELAHLIDRLGARFGLRRITRPVPQDSHIPEFAVAAVAAHGNLSDLVLRSRAQHGVSKDGSTAGTRGHPSRRAHPSPSAHPSTSAQERAPQDEAENFFTTAPTRIQADSLSPPRPIRLFGRPEAIEAIAEVPDGPPVRFRWRRVLHQVAHAEGPERIAMEWWRDHQGRALTRDYFRVESREGVRVWVYREGLYGRELMEPRWFLHGLFA
jgi:protein ImuB